MKSFFFISLVLFGQTKLYSQKDSIFWFACPNIVNSQGNIAIDSPLYLYISAYDKQAIVTVSQPVGLMPIIIDTINANTSKKINLSSWKNLLECNMPGVVQNKGLKITSNSLISLYYQVNPDGFNQETFVLKGKNALGTVFRIPMQDLFDNKDSTQLYNYSSSPRSSFYVVATEDNTQVTITLKNNGVGVTTSPTVFTMNKGQTINIQNQSRIAAFSLAGSQVASTKPVAITVAEDIVDATNFYGIDCGEDLIGEQLVSIAPVDTFYTVVKGLSRVQYPAPNSPPEYEYLFVTSIANTTMIYVNNVFNQAIAPNTTARIPVHFIDSAIKVTTDFPAYLYHNSGFGCQFGASLVPPSNCPGSTKINFMRYTSDSLFLYLNIKKGYQSAFKINGLPMSASMFKYNKSYDTSWVYALVYLPISNYPKDSTIRVENQSMFFHMAVLQGNSSSGASLGYFSEFNKNYAIKLYKSKDTFCEGDSIKFYSDTLLGLNYYWTGPNGFVDTVQNPIIKNATSLNSGTYYLSTSITGCSSRLDSIKIVVNPKTFGTIHQTICQGNSFLFNGINRTVSGAYLDTLINAKGCDSILTLNLTVNPKTTSTINQTICEGSSFLGRTTSGTYIDTLLGANAKGCDSIRTLVLIVNPKTYGTINQTICQGSSVLFNGFSRTVSGAYLDTLVNAKGCDSIITLNLTVNPKTFGSFSQTICEGSSFLFNGFNRTISGIYLDTLINAKGCDSILTLNLTVNPKTFGSLSQTICEGSSFLFNGISRTVSGAYLDTLVNAKGCDSILTLNLTVNPKTFGTIHQTICQGNSFLFNGINRTVSGAYLDTLINAKGCDSILTLNLTVNPKTFSTINHTICEGSSFLGRATSGTYIDTLLGANAKGCDSIRTLVLTVNPKTFSNFKEIICEGESFFNRTKTGTYHDTFINTKGCDSIRTLSLTVNPISRTIINRTICFGDIFLGKSTTGKHIDTFTNLFGCDSIREINLIVLSPVLTNLNYEICQGEIFRGRSSSGIFVDTVKNILGCDSILETVDLYVRPNIDSSFKVRICEGTSYRGKTIAGNYVDSFQNNYGCKSIYRYELTFNPKSNSFETKTICNNQKYKGYTKSGIYKDTLFNYFGCDSVISLTLNVKPNFIFNKLKDTTINEGDTVLLQSQKGFLLYTWNTKQTTSGILVNNEGRYNVTIMNHDGCIGYDSCNVYINPKDTSGTDTLEIDSIDGYVVCPNVFSPNDDFKNDFFIPMRVGSIKITDFSIFNRWGEMVYSSNVYFYWDGVYKGEKCEPGVYVYYLKFENRHRKEILKGSVTLIR